MKINKTFLTLGLAATLLQMPASSFAQTAGGNRQNPLLTKSSLPFGAPDFSKIQESDYLPAIEAAIREQRANIQKIVNNKKKPNFQNTILAYEESGALLEKVTNIFFGLTSAHKTPGIAETEKKATPLLTELDNEISFNKKLFERIKYVYDNEYKKLKGEDKRLTEVIYKSFVRSGAIFCSIGEAVKEHPDLVREYLGTVVPYRDNFYAALNSCVFSDGSFVYIPKGVRCPMELSSYFRINARNTGQFERTLIIADDDAYVSYLEGCTAPMRDENQLHAAIVEIIVKDNAEVKYSTVQNWYPGDEHGKGGVLNLVTKRGDLRGVNSKLSWTQVETGSAITWKYPSCILRGDNSVAEFYSVAVTNNYQEADTGTKMIHMGKNTKSTIISKGISAGHSQNSYRGLVRATSNADNARNYSSCDSLLLGSDCGAHTFPYMDAHNDTAVFEHEATTSKISEDQLFYCNQRGIPTEEAVGLIVNGYAKDVLNKLPMEFAVEAQKLLSVSLEGTVG